MYEFPYMIHVAFKIILWYITSRQHLRLCFAPFSTYLGSYLAHTLDSLHWAVSWPNSVGTHNSSLSRRDSTRPNWRFSTLRVHHNIRVENLVYKSPIYSHLTQIRKMIIYVLWVSCVLHKIFVRYRFCCTRNSLHKHADIFQWKLVYFPSQILTHMHLLYSVFYLKINYNK